MIYGGIRTVADVIAAVAPSKVIKALATGIGLGATGVGIATEFYYFLKSDGLRYTGVSGSRTYRYLRNNDSILEWIFVWGSKTETFYIN